VETISVACGFGSLRRMDRAFARTIAKVVSRKNFGGYFFDFWGGSALSQFDCGT
jgi:hypothetical protein